MKEIRGKKTQAVRDFLDGTNEDIEGQVQICTIADVYGDRVSALKSRDRLAAVINDSGDAYPFLKFSWEYDQTEEKARYILFGTPEFMIRAMEILK